MCYVRVPALHGTIETMDNADHYTVVLYRKFELAMLRCCIDLSAIRAVRAYHMELHPEIRDVANVPFTW